MTFSFLLLAAVLGAEGPGDAGAPEPLWEEPLAMPAFDAGTAESWPAPPLPGPPPPAPAPPGPVGGGPAGEPRVRPRPRRVVAGAPAAGPSASRARARPCSRSRSRPRGRREAGSRATSARGEWAPPPRRRRVGSDLLSF